MAEVCRAQLWSWRHHGVEVSDGQILDDALLDQLIEEEFASLHATLDPAQWANGRFDEARTLLRDLVTTTDYPEFLTIPAYELL